MRITLTDYNSTEGSTFRIYRSYEAFTENNLPAPLVELPAGTEEWTDETLPLQRIAYYRVGVVHNGNDVVGPLYTTMKRYYSGPQISQTEPDMILRGTYQAGRYGTMSTDSVLPLSDIFAELTSLSPDPDVDLSHVEYEKCSYQGKVLFIPTIPFAMGSFEGLYNDAALFTLADGKVGLSSTFYNSLPTKVEQGKVFRANGSSFKVRPMSITEYLELYIGLFPNTTYGNMSNYLVGNCIAHDKTISVLRPSQTDQVTALNLNDTEGELRTWSTVSTQLLVVELMNRADTVFPEPGVNVVDEIDDRLYFTNVAIVNDRFHVFGGVPSIYTTPPAAVTTHISFDLDGGDRQEHAPMLTGVSRAVVWTHANKIYAFGGVTQFGSTEWSTAGKYSGLQVWEDDGTGVGEWTTLEPSVEYQHMMTGTTYTDPNDGIDKILIMGGEKDVVPAARNNLYHAPLVGFDGTFSQSSTSVYNFAGGTPVLYNDLLYYIGGGYLPNGYSSVTYTCKIPASATAYWSWTSMETQDNELPTTKLGYTAQWRDTLFYVSDRSSAVEDDRFSFYQFIEAEKRWRRISFVLPGHNNRNSVSAASKDNRIICWVSSPYLAEQYKSKIVVIDLIDPLEKPLEAVYGVYVTVDRFLPGWHSLRYN